MVRRRVRTDARIVLALGLCPCVGPVLLSLGVSALAGHALAHITMSRSRYYKPLCNGITRFVIHYTLCNKVSFVIHYTLVMDLCNVLHKLTLLQSVLQTS